MNIREIFTSHFEQCDDAASEFKINGAGYRGKWRNNDSMSLFLKDLEEAVADEDADRRLSEKSLNEEIEKLELKLAEARK